MSIIRPSRCETCALYNAAPGKQQGECRRNPPHVATFLVPGPNGQPQHMCISSFPQVTFDTWCGDHKPGLAHAAALAKAS